MVKNKKNLISFVIASIAVVLVFALLITNYGSVFGVVEALTAQLIYLRSKFSVEIA